MKNLRIINLLGMIFMKIYIYNDILYLTMVIKFNTITYEILYMFALIV